jgi:3-hydroxyisobutyrate dehydrogenase-like beta-hydroxyacid dehydrogenase
MMFERVWFVGLGIMGKPMARNLLSVGYNLVVQTRGPKKAEELVKEGAEAARSSREVAEKSSVIITTDARPPNVLQPG